MNRLLCLALLTALATPALAEASAEEKRAQRRADMVRIFADMRVLLPLSVDERALAKSKVAREAVANVARSAETLAAHSRRDEPSLRVLSRALADDATALKARFDRGAFDEAAFTLHQMTRTCIACHTRLKSEGSPLAEAFAKDDEVKKLPPRERVAVQLATRQFEPALDTFEAWFADAKVHPSAFLAPIDDYLVTAVRVRGDLARAEKTLGALSERDDVWTELRGDLAEWRTELRVLAKAPPARTLVAARETLAQAAARKRYPADERGRVYEVLAGGILREVLEQPGLSAADRADAYYLLARVEEATPGDYWVPEPAAYLEACVRTVPKTPQAARCFGRLEDHLVRAYAGTGGVKLPDDEKARLDELRALTP